MQHTSAHREDEQLVLHLSQQLEQQEARIHLLNQLQVFVAERCKSLLCVAVCFSKRHAFIFSTNSRCLLQSIAVCCNALQQEVRIHLHKQLWVSVAVRCSALQCVAAGGAMHLLTQLQVCVAVCCSVLQQEQIFLLKQLQVSLCVSVAVDVHRSPETTTGVHTCMCVFWREGASACKKKRENRGLVHKRVNLRLDFIKKCLPFINSKR